MKPMLGDVAAESSLFAVALAWSFSLMSMGDLAGMQIGLWHESKFYEPNARHYFALFFSPFM